MSGPGISPAKILFRSPKGPEGGADDPGTTTGASLTGSGSASLNDDTSKGATMDMLTLKLQIEHDTQARLTTIQQELHEQRITSLRKLMQEINEDDWQYPDPDRLLGLK